jgi:hypothetical protein
MKLSCRAVSAIVLSPYSHSQPDRPGPGELANRPDWILGTEVDRVGVLRARPQIALIVRRTTASLGCSICASDTPADPSRHLPHHCLHCLVPSLGWATMRYSHTRNQLPTTACPYLAADVCSLFPERGLKGSSCGGGGGSIGGPGTGFGSGWIGSGGGGTGSGRGVGSGSGGTVSAGTGTRRRGKLLLASRSVITDTSSIVASGLPTRDAVESVPLNAQAAVGGRKSAYRLGPDREKFQPAVQDRCELNSACGESDGQQGHPEQQPDHVVPEVS